MSKTIDVQYETSVSFLGQLVDHNSGTMNFEGVSAVGDMMRRQLEALDFEVVWKPMAAAGRAGHLIAVHHGKPGTKRLLLIAHLDTVFEKSSPFQRFDRQGDTAVGPGAGDDKGGMVVMLAALRAIAAAGTLRDANIEIVLSGDEEHVGDPIAIARADLVAAGKRADVALDFEALGVENGRDMGSIARRSSNSWTIRATGTSGHSSQIFSATFGDGAVFELVRILQRFRQELPEDGLTFNVGLIAGGARAEIAADGQASASGKSNIIPATAVARGDFRTLTDEQAEHVRSKMRAIVADHAPQTGATIEFAASTYPAMPPTDGNRRLLDRLNSVNRDLGLAEMPPLDPLKRGAGDISFVAKDVDGLVGLGTAGKGEHAPGEMVSLPSITRQAKRAAILMSRLSREKR